LKLIKLKPTLGTMATITEWEEVLLKKGIIAKTEDIENGIVPSPFEDVKNTNKDKREKDDEDEIDALLNDDLDGDDFMQRYREMRISEIRAATKKKDEIPRFAEVIEISGSEYVDQVNKAGKDIKVVVHLYDDGVPLCKIINEHLKTLAVKFPHTKFIKSIANLCIPNFPISQLPAIFFYEDGELRNKLVGTAAFGDPLSQDALEWIISSIGAIKTELESDPRNRVKINRSGGRRIIDADDSDSD